MAGQWIQENTLDREDLRASMDKVRFLETSFNPLRTSLDDSEVENKNLRAKNEGLKEKYEALEIQSRMDVSWTLRTLCGMLKEALDEFFEAAQHVMLQQLEKVEEVIEASQQLMGSSHKDNLFGDRLNLYLPDEEGMDEYTESLP